MLKNFKFVKFTIPHFFLNLIWNFFWYNFEKTELYFQKVSALAFDFNMYTSWWLISHQKNCQFLGISLFNLNNCIWNLTLLFHFEKQFQPFHFGFSIVKNSNQQLVKINCCFLRWKSSRFIFSSRISEIENQKVNWTKLKYNLLQLQSRVLKQKKIYIPRVFLMILWFKKLRLVKSQFFCKFHRVEWGGGVIVC